MVLTTPNKLPLLFTFALGIPHTGEFVRLNASALNSTVALSVTGNLRNTEASKLARPSDLSTFRLKFPQQELGNPAWEAEHVGIANAVVLNQQFTVPTLAPLRHVP